MEGKIEKIDGQIDDVEREIKELGKSPENKAEVDRLKEERILLLKRQTQLGDDKSSLRKELDQLRGSKENAGMMMMMVMIIIIIDDYYYY